LGQVFGIIDQDSDITIEYPLGGIDRNGPQGSMRIFGDQFGNFVDDIYNDRDLYKKERAEVNRKVNTYRDGNSAERIAKRVFG